MNGNKKTFILYIVGCSLVGLLVVGLAVGINIYNKHKKESQKTAITEQLINLGIDEDKALNMSTEEAAETLTNITTEQFLPGYEFDKDKKEYGDTDSTLNYIYTYAGSKNWGAIINLVNGIKDKYNFTTFKNMEIIGAYKDAFYLQKSAEWNQSEYENFLDGANSTVGFLMAVTELPGNNILKYFDDATSQFPGFSTDYRIESFDHFDLTVDADYNKLKQDNKYIFLKEYLEENNYTAINKIRISGRINNEYSYTICYLGDSSNLFHKVVGCYGDDIGLFTVGEWNEVKY